MTGNLLAQCQDSHIRVSVPTTHNKEGRCYVMMRSIVNQKKMKPGIWVVVCCSVLWMSSCDKDDNEMDPALELDCDVITPTYSDNIKQIVDTNCAISGCHDGSNANPDFTNYDGLFARRSQVRSRVVSGTMPPAGRPDLDDSEIDEISCWVENGAPE